MRDLVYFSHWDGFWICYPIVSYPILPIARTLFFVFAFAHLLVLFSACGFVSAAFVIVCGFVSAFVHLSVEAAALMEFLESAQLPVLFCIRCAFCCLHSHNSSSFFLPAVLCPLHSSLSAVFCLHSCIRQLRLLH